jgi:hypothetical protein
MEHSPVRQPMSNDLATVSTKRQLQFCLEMKSWVDNVAKAEVRAILTSCQDDSTRVSKLAHIASEHY